MSTKAHFQTLFAYQGDMYQRLLDCAVLLDEATYKQRQPYCMGSLHDILFHVLYWHNLWRVSLEGDNNYGGFQAQEFTDVAALRATMQDERNEWQRVLDGLTDADFEEEQSVLGVTAPRWRILQHLLLHSMQHHSEAASLLTAKGYSPKNIDFIWYTG